MNDEYSGKNVLITGGTGSIGLEITKQILGFDINKAIVFSRDEIKHFLIKKNMPDNRLEMVVGDVRNYQSLERVFEQFDIDFVFHAAAMKHVVVCDNFPMECAKTNIIGTQNVVDLALKHNVPRMITISTDKSAYPVNVMGATKFIAEKITLNANYSCVRFGNVANSRGSVVPVFIDSLLNGMPITITNPNATRFIIQVKDAVHLVMDASKYAQGGDIFILKMKAFKLGDLMEVILDRIAPELGLNSGNITVKEIGLLQGEKLHEQLINDSESRYLFESGQLYVILSDPSKQRNYKYIKKSNKSNYSSNDVELLSKYGLEQIIMEYIKKNHLSVSSYKF